MDAIAATALLTPDREIRPGGLEIADDGTVSGVGSMAGPSPGVLTPGLIDLQCNGAAGASLAGGDRDAFDAVALALLAAGTTAWCPTLPTAHPEAYPRFLEAVHAARSRRGPRVIGAHLEGPFLSSVRAGAHPPEALRTPDLAWLQALLDGYPDIVRIVTIAPELPGALDVIRLCVERGIVVALGHTDATVDEAMAGFDAGATMLTHLFNAMRPLHHRDPGVIGAALSVPDVRIGLIADGAHIDPRVASFFARALGPRRTVLVSDAVAVPMTDPLRGGFVLLDGAIRNIVAWGSSFSDAVTMATATAAAAVGETGLGTLELGAHADVVRWVDGRVDAVWIGGERT